MRDHRGVGQERSVKERAPRRALLAAVAVVGVALVAAPAALGHATVRPASSRPADLQVYTVTVPNEREVTSNGVAVQIPERIDFVLVDEAPGWRVKPERSGGRISVLRWSGGTIEPDFYESLQFIARNPVQEGTITWKVIQDYEDGTKVRWIGAAGSDTPASSTRISESAEPTDVVTVHGEEAAASNAAAPADGGGGGGGDDSDDLARILAIVGIALAVLGFVASYRLRRRRSA